MEELLVLQGAYKPDKEAVDTGASGMGTQMRQLGGIGKAAMSGAIDGFKKRRAEVEKGKMRKTGTTGTKVTGPTDTRPGSTGASSFFGGLLKSGIKKVAGIKDDDKKQKAEKKLLGILFQNLRLQIVHLKLNLVRMEKLVQINRTCLIETK